jgi:hypothetical protein
MSSSINTEHDSNIRYRVDFRNGHPDLAAVAFPDETVDQKNSRLGLSNIDTVDTVYVRRRDGVIKLLSIAYDPRNETYDGFLIHRDPSTTMKKRDPLTALQYSSWANSSPNTYSHDDVNDEVREETIAPLGYHPYFDRRSAFLFSFI